MVGAKPIQVFNQEEGLRLQPGEGATAPIRRRGSGSNQEERLRLHTALRADHANEYSGPF